MSNNNLIVNVIAGGGSSGGGLKTDMSNLDSDISNADQTTIAGKLAVPVYDDSISAFNLKNAATIIAEEPILYTKSTVGSSAYSIVGDPDNCHLQFITNNILRIVVGTSGISKIQFMYGGEGIVQITESGYDAYNKKVSNVATGTEELDAVNFSQLNTKLNKNFSNMEDLTDEQIDIVREKLKLPTEELISDALHAFEDDNLFAGTLVVG